MTLDRYTVLHRKDERGVIVESGVYGPDDEIPEGFGPAEYQPIYAPREDDQAPVDDVDQKPWDSALSTKSQIVGGSSDEVDDGTPREARGYLTGADEEAVSLLESDEDDSDDSDDETDEGTPRQAREDLTGAEEEQDEAAEESADDSGDVEDETDGGTPVQAVAESVTAPPQGGPGSGKEAWAQYAGAQTVNVPEGASRDEIIAAVKAAGKPVD